MQKTDAIATVGEILVEFVSHTKGCALEQITQYSGPYPSGAPAIFLDQAARMGARTLMFGGVGDDGFGRAILKRLKDDGVGTEGVSIVKGRTTGTAFVSYFEDGRRDFIFHLANTAADSFHIAPDTLPQDPGFLHISAASLGIAPLRDSILSTMRHVLNAGGKITCDPNARPELMTDVSAREALQEVVAHSYCLMPSTSDLNFLFPDLKEEEAIDHLLQSRAKIIVIKRGAAGATVVGNGKRHDFAGHKVTEIDPTGAGDCFCGTFVSLLAQGASLDRAGQLANAAGAISVTRRGPMEGNSTLKEIESFLSARGITTEGTTA
ncbi:carbohydrate kinase family protein [Phaeovulum sp.]|uniref:carbohydrate kinase family protein n=1 Tax=Phaeovulum sp. TaxID=2934796 RepID=UPI0039E310BD